MNKNTVKGKNDKEKSGGSNRILELFRSILNGKILAGEKVADSMPFILFLTAIAFLLIMNSYYAEKKGRVTEALRDDLVELRTRHVLTRSALMYLSNQSEIARRVEPMGLKESRVPPVIVVDDRRRSSGILNALIN